jgi:hypothetical protein
MATTTTIPTGYTSQITKFGAFTPDVLQQMALAEQNTFYTPLRADITLTAAQVLTLQTADIPIVAAPGAGLMIVPLSALIRVQCNTAAFTDAGGGAVSFKVGTMAQALTANTVFTGPTAGQRSQQTIVFNGTSTAANPPTNENASFGIGKATANFAAGGTSVVHITVYYTVESTT